MITNTYKIADKNVKISSFFEAVHILCRDYISCEKADFSVTVCDEDIAFERNKSEQEDLAEGIEIRQFSDDYLETLAIYRKIAEQMIDYNTVLFHGSAIAVDGCAYLFSAKSGTGKSTHTKLWRALLGDRAVMVNDDKPLLKVTDSGVYVCGTPWNGKHRLGNNIIVPLKAVCILSRSSENHIERLDSKGAFLRLMEFAYHSSQKDKLVKTIGLVNKISSKVNLYSLGCNMQPDAAIVAYNAMKGN